MVRSIVASGEGIPKLTATLASGGPERQSVRSSWADGQGRAGKGKLSDEAYDATCFVASGGDQIIVYPHANTGRYLEIVPASIVTPDLPISFSADLYSVTLTFDEDVSGPL